RGLALIIVLAALILLSALVLSFFTSVTTEMVSSTNYSNEEKSKMLADTAVNLVMGQIRDATTGVQLADDGTPSTNTALRTAWASQPGMIRNWDATGLPYKN